MSAHNKVISHEGFIDEMNVDEGLSESGFYIIENINGKLKVPFKFSQTKNFVVGDLVSFFEEKYPYPLNRLV